MKNARKIRKVYVFPNFTCIFRSHHDSEFVSISKFTEFSTTHHCDQSDFKSRDRRTRARIWTGVRVEYVTAGSDTESETHVRRALIGGEFIFES